MLMSHKLSNHIVHINIVNTHISWLLLLPMMTCCKEKAVLVAVYKENPRKARSATTRNNNTNNIRHDHHHHYHHHFHVHPPKTNKGNRKAELLSYSQHLRKSSKQEPPAPAPPHPPKSLTPYTTNDHKTPTQVHGVQKEQKLKKQSSLLDMKRIFECFAVSHAKRKAKKKKRKSGESATKKASVIMKRFNARTKKGASGFFSKLMATIQKYR